MFIDEVVADLRMLFSDTPDSREGGRIESYDVGMFEFVLWGSTGLIVAGLLAFWWRQDARERKEAELFKRWANATVWNNDPSAKVVVISRTVEDVASLSDGVVEIEALLTSDSPVVAEAGWYLLIAGWTDARDRAKRGEPIVFGPAEILDSFPPHTPELVDRLSGRGDRPPRIASRLLGFRGL
ncbi:hypothetical protein AB4Z09_24155 [Rhodococcus sp. TAF43]|uniref:hypothetical protein n=1 Tax=Rhodococcus sp. TAF43 TaxID=3237483 RepID=UPI003F9CB444